MHYLGRLARAAAARISGRIRERQDRSAACMTHAPPFRDGLGPKCQGPRLASPKVLLPAMRGDWTQTVCV